MIFALCATVIVLSIVWLVLWWRLPSDRLIGNVVRFRRREIMKIIIRYSEHDVIKEAVIEGQNVRATTNANPGFVAVFAGDRATAQGYGDVPVISINTDRVISVVQDPPESKPAATLKIT